MNWERNTDCKEKRGKMLSDIHVSTWGRIKESDICVFKCLMT